MLAGVILQPVDPFQIDLKFAWNVADASIQQFQFVVPPTALSPNQSWDFSDTYLNSDLDLSRLEASLGMQYELNDTLFLGADYRWIDVSDDAPYRGDATGDISIYSLSLGWMF